MPRHCLCETYTLRNSWAVASNDAVSEEEAVPVVLVDNSGLWKPAYPHSVLQDGAEKPKESVKSKTKDAAPMSSAFRVFSYRMEEMTVPPHLHHTRIRRGPSDTLQLLHEAHCHSTFTVICCVQITARYSLCITLFQIKSNVFIKPFLHQLISQSAVQKPSLKPQTASNAGVEARWLGRTP